jgi:hypothetical protein
MCGNCQFCVGRPKEVLRELLVGKAMLTTRSMIDLALFGYVL